MFIGMSAEHRPRISESKVRRRIHGSKTDEVTEEWRTIHSMELVNCYFLCNVTAIESIIMSANECIMRHVAWYRVLVGKLSGKTVAWILKA
jgi:hypothetical protein